ncbi:hypothetical protein YC2023_031144 [Brassica napus]
MGHPYIKFIRKVKTFHSISHSTNKVKEMSTRRRASLTSCEVDYKYVIHTSHLQEQYSVIHEFILVGRANHYIPCLKVGFIVKVDRFEVTRCSIMYKIIDHPFLIRFISPTIIDEVITGAPEINLQSLLDCLTISK